MNVSSLNLTSIQAMSYLTQYTPSAASGQDSDGDNDGSGRQDQVNFSAQAQFLGGQVQQGPSPFKDLADALQAGDLTGARDAFAAIQKRIQARRAEQPENKANPSRAAQGGQKSQFSQDFAALGQALQSGDLEAAKQAFAALQQDLPSARPHHHHHHGAGAAGNAQGTTSTAAENNASLLSLTYTSISITSSEDAANPASTSTTA